MSFWTVSRCCTGIKLRLGGDEDYTNIADSELAIVREGLHTYYGGSYVYRGSH